MYPQLTEYIKKSKDQGLGDEQINKNLLSAGWSLQDINTAMGALQSSVLMPSGIQPKIQNPSIQSVRPKSKHTLLKVLLVVLLLVALGAGAYAFYMKQISTQTPIPTSIAQNTNPAPASTSDFKTITNDTLDFSVSIPQDDNLVVGVQTGQPVNYGYAIENATTHNADSSAPIAIQMHAGQSLSGADILQDVPDFFSISNDYARFTKPFTTTTGLKGMIYNNPNPNPDPLTDSHGNIYPYTKEAVVIYYPNSSLQDMHPSVDVQLQYPLIEIAMAGTDAPFTTDQQTLFMKVVNSFQFTGNQPSLATTPVQAQSTSSNSTTITLDATTKIAVVQAIMNAYTNILSSNDPTKIRNYIEIEEPSQKAAISAESDSQILQIAKYGVSMGIPEANLATDPAATWQVNSNVATVTLQKSGGISVTYQAVYINGAWH